MKKIVTVLAATALSVSTVGYAASGPTVFPHGIASSAPVVTPEGVTQGTIGDTVTKAQGAIPETEKNAANGVAGLDSSGNMTSTLAAKGSSRLMDTNGVSVVSINPGQGDESIPGQDNWAEGSLIHPHALTIANARVGASGSDQDYNANGQLVLAGSPDGPDTNGCLLCIFDTTTPLNIAGISGGGSTNWVNGPTGISQYGSADSPLEYLVQDNANMQVMNLTVASYTATEIVLASPLSDHDKERIHYGMYVISNSVDPSLAAPDFSATTNLPSPNYYASTVVKVIDSTHIQVSGWAVPGAGNNASGQVPSISNLDTKWTNFGKPTVGIGGRTNTSAVNWVTNFTTTNSWLNNYENEIDILGDPGFAAGRMRIHGLTMTYQGPTPSADSWALNLNTIALPVQLHMEVNPNGYGIQSNSFITKGNAGVGSLGDDFEMFEHAAFTDSANDMRLVGSVKKETSDSGWLGTSATIGLRIDGDQGNVSTGSPMGRLTFNPLMTGSTSLETGGWALGGPTTYQFGTVKGSPTILNGQYLAFQPSGWEDGTVSPIIQAASSSQLNIRDTGGNGITLDTYILNADTAKVTSGVFNNITSNTLTTLNGSVFSDDFYLNNNKAFYMSSANAGEAKAEYFTLSSDGKTILFGTDVSGGGNISGVNTFSSQNIEVSGNLQSNNFSTSGQGIKAGSGVFEGLTGAPDSDLKQGYALGWNSGLSSQTMGNVWGGTDFYNLKGLGAGGFNWCVGEDAATCKSNNVMALTSNGTLYTNAVNTKTVSAAVSLTIPFATPASSTSTCTQGQIEMDADYIYSCVATNTWHRVSNGSSW